MKEEGWRKELEQGEKLRKLKEIKRKALICFQCGVCVGSCPVAFVNEKYNPRRILRNFLFNQSPPQLNLSNLPWLCLHCYACLERCPQNIGLSEVMFKIQHLQFLNGEIPSSFLNAVKQIIKTGRVSPVTPITERRREQLNLPKIETETGVEELKKIIKETGLKKLLFSQEEEKRSG